MKLKLSINKTAQQTKGTRAPVLEVSMQHPTVAKRPGFSPRNLETRYSLAISTSQRQQMTAHQISESFWLAKTFKNILSNH